jgi:hypothetical protein
MWNPDHVYTAEQARWAELQAEGERRPTAQDSGSSCRIGTAIQALARSVASQRQRAEWMGTMLLRVLTKQ